MTPDAGISKIPLWHLLRASLAAWAVEIEDAVEARSFLDRNPDMYGPTQRICESARREFGTEALLTLRVLIDPETDDQYLLLRVRLRSYPSDTMCRIRSVSEPFADELSDKSSSIIVTTDFHPIW